MVLVRSPNFTGPGSFDGHPDCADGLAVSRSTLHFLTFAHKRARHYYYFVPSECGPGTYTRKTRVPTDGTKKPSPNTTTLLCLEKPEAER